MELVIPETGNKQTREKFSGCAITNNYNFSFQTSQKHKYSSISRFMLLLRRLTIHACSPMYILWEFYVCCSSWMEFVVSRGNLILIGEKNNPRQRRSFQLMFVGCCCKSEGEFARHGLIEIGIIVSRLQRCTRCWIIAVINSNWKPRARWRNREWNCVNLFGLNSFFPFIKAIALWFIETLEKFPLQLVPQFDEKSGKVS